ncbi:hypothetical protein COCOBI_02-6700 [Coccomyxa sp. Obi]|nr:hypothetical protein COCOBI_02-6700 [Coccomyxa sp. Obi]
MIHDRRSVTGACGWKLGASLRARTIPSHTAPHLRCLPLRPAGGVAAGVPPSQPATDTKRAGILVGGNREGTRVSAFLSRRRPTSAPGARLV